LKLIIQPEDGLQPLIHGIEHARKSIEIAIFRFDRKEVERALGSAVKRGVLVHTLIADTNRNGERELRKLETRLLAKGVTVARTSDDLVRYHGKMMIVDGRELYVLAFNFTRLDIDHSRSFGVITKNHELVQEASRLFEADTKRQPYVARSRKFLVSPVNARELLSSFIKGAKRELLIYDAKVSDRAMVRLLEERAKAGVTIRIIGRVTRGHKGLEARKLPQLRLHTRNIIRDQRQLFLGSQSLRELELDARREVGVILHDSRVVKSIIKVFEEDWSLTAASREPREPVQKGGEQVTKAVTKAAELVAGSLSPVAPVVEHAVRRTVGASAEIELDHKEVEATVKSAVQTAVEKVVREVVEEAVEEHEQVGK
jgi:cardiolipin synthase A/B